MPFFISYGDNRNGSAQGISGTVNTYATCTGTAGSRAVTTSLSVSVGDMVFLWQTQGTGAGNREMVKVAAVGGGSFTTTTALDNSYVSGAQAIKVPQYSSGTPGALSATAWNGSTGGLAVILANGTITLGNAISLNGAGYRGGGDPGSGQTFGVQGEGQTGVGTETNGANGVGGGGGDFIGGGGVGGAGGGLGTGGGSTSGGGGTSTGGSVGGSSDLVTLILGGGGGSGGTNNGGGTRGDGLGGRGGGIGIIIAPSITVTASQSSTGDNGTSTANSNAGGGGGGGGGAWIFAGNNIALGSGLVTALGGSGGGGGATGASGGNGIIAVYSPASGNVSGTTNPSYTFLANTSLVTPAQGFFV